ncbi:hypothetical protein ElyMa_007012800 [Elysia marginata]|uniref:Uncharacterized protein n=1 Tax=Elysia marginata TaxID=1093978 RepID=A0AAV4JPW4_9GAST|nr:hypothetical protein ElyMa_007012800 [Elysia marginata]
MRELMERRLSIQTKSEKQALAGGEGEGERWAEGGQNLNTIWRRSDALVIYDTRETRQKSLDKGENCRCLPPLTLVPGLPWLAQ